MTPGNENSSLGSKPPSPTSGPELSTATEKPSATVADGALVLGWHHSTRSVAAHCFEGDRPLCQDSDPGEILDRNRPNRLLGRVCSDCRAVYKARITFAIRRAREARDA